MVKAIIGGLYLRIRMIADGKETRILAYTCSIWLRNYHVQD